MILLLKFIIGGVIALSIDLISKTKYYYNYISGLIPLFPAFGLLAHIIVFNNKGIPELKDTILVGLLSLIPYAIYLLSLFFLLNKFNFKYSIIFAIFLWFISAFLLIYFYNK